MLRILSPLIWSGFLLVAVKASHVLSHGTQNVTYFDIKGWEREVFRSETLLSGAVDDHSELIADLELEATSTEVDFGDLSNWRLRTRLCIKFWTTVGSR